jgi:hypothetical protein
VVEIRGNSGVDNIGQLQAELDRMREEMHNTPSQEVQNLLHALNHANFRDANGGHVGFETLEEWRSAFDSGMITGLKSGGQEQLRTMLQNFGARIDAALAPLRNLEQGIESLKAMKQLLESGDISGAVMLLQTTRANGLDAQLRTQVTAMQNRNIQIQTLNSQLATEQGKNPRNEAEITRINAAIQKANGDSQLQMIDIQDLVNKRNQAYDMLSNLLNKFQKTLDGIVGNMR